MVVSYANTHADVTDHVGFGVDSPLIETFFSPFFFLLFFFFLLKILATVLRTGASSVCLSGRLAFPLFPTEPEPAPGEEWGVGGGSQQSSILERPCRVSTFPARVPAFPAPAQVRNFAPARSTPRPARPAPSPARRAPATPAQLSHRRRRRRGSRKCVVNGTWPGL